MKMTLTAAERGFIRAGSMAKGESFASADRCADAAEDLLAEPFDHEDGPQVLSDWEFERKRLYADADVEYWRERCLAAEQCEDCAAAAQKQQMEWEAQEAYEADIMAGLRDEQNADCPY